MLELADLVLKLVGSKSTIQHVALPADDPRQRCPDITKAKRILKWEPRVNLEEGLQSTMTYFKEIFATAKKARPSSVASLAVGRCTNRNLLLGANRTTLPSLSCTVAISDGPVE